MDQRQWATLVALGIGLALGQGGAPQPAEAGACGQIRGVAKKGCVTKRDLKKNAVTSSKVKNRSLTGKDIKDGSIGASDLAPDAVARPTYVFLASEQHDGAFGVTVWDAVCQADAEDAGLSPGLYRAWLSTGGFDAGDMLPPGPFVDTAGNVVALNKADLLNGTILRGIELFASGVSVGAPVAAWTGTAPDGTFLAPNCADWGTNGAAAKGRIGATDRTDGGWTSVFTSDCSDATRYAYCFQVQ